MGLPEGVKPAIGDLADAAAVRAAFEGVTHASVLLPMVYEAPVVESYVRNIAAAAAEAGVRRLVFNTGNRIPSGPTSVKAFETRRAAEAVLAASGVPTVVLRPPVYLDNLCAPWVAGPLVHEGVLGYPLPANVPVSWLSHDDLATATVAALTTPDLFTPPSPSLPSTATPSTGLPTPLAAPISAALPATVPSTTADAPATVPPSAADLPATTAPAAGPLETSPSSTAGLAATAPSAAADLPTGTQFLAFDLGGPDAVTGTQLAAAFTTVLGRPVRYVAQDIDEFEAGLAFAFGPSTAEGVASTYRWVADKDQTLYGQNSADVEATLGVRLTRLHDWLTSRPWKEIAG